MFGTNRIAVEDGSHTSEARRTARKMAEDIGFDMNRAEQVAIVVTEVCTNLLKHAGGGEILLTTWAPETGGSRLDVLALDRGPGIENLTRCVEDGFSTGGSPGQGLGAIIRLSDTSDFYSIPGKGAAVLAGWKGAPNGSLPSPSLRTAARFEIGGIEVPKPGQEVCGDSWGNACAEDQITILVADGLGHGLDAQTASIEAVRMLHRNPDLPLRMLIDRVHQALRSTRGAAVAAARIDLAAQNVMFAGAGNIAAHIYTDSGAQHLVSANGTAGHQMDKLNEFTYRWPPGAILIMHSDGLTTGAGLANHPGLSTHPPAMIAGVLYRDFKRGYDDATVVVAKAA